MPNATWPSLCSPRPPVVDLRATNVTARTWCSEVNATVASPYPRARRTADAWGISVPSLVVRAHDRSLLSDYHYRTMFRILNETGLVYGDRPGVANEQPRLVTHVLDRLMEAGFNDNALATVTLLTNEECIELFGTGEQRTPPLHLEG